MSMFDSFQPGGTKHTLLQASLEAAVPLYIAELEAQGGPDEHDIASCQEIASEIGAHGDALMFRVKGKTAQLFNKLAFGLAVMAFCPNGVEFLGVRWRAGSANEGATGKAVGHAMSSHREGEVAIATFSEAVRQAVV